MTNSLSPPLAEQLRPESLDEVIGQEHLLGKGRPLRLAFETQRLHSMILWGPPGVGKTTIARLTAKALGCEWIALSAVFAGVKDIRAAIEAAKIHLQDKRPTILFIDEIHRFNKAQQDALLPHTESGLITFIGATTENPSFEVNSSLLSRAQVYVLKPLTEQQLRQLFARAHQTYLPSIEFEEEAIVELIDHADGDARRLLNEVEQLKNAALSQQKDMIDSAFITHTMSALMHRFDKGGDYFYDQISALHKSVRGSDPDAALYWFCRMIDAGADPRYLARRIIRMSFEDIGLADPRAMQISLDAAQTYDRLGSPEGELALAEAVMYVAVAPKSNAGYVAYNEAMAYVKQDKSREVPIHLRNAPTALLKKMGHGKAYRYAHSEPHGYATNVHYFPQDMPSKKWYKPVGRGLEIKIAERLAYLRQLDEQAKNDDK